VIVPGSALAFGTQFTIAPPPLGHPVYEKGQVQYRAGATVRHYGSEGTDLTGSTLGLSRRQTLSDRFAFNVGGQADYLSGTEYVVSPDNDLHLWRVMLHVTGEYQQRFTPGWNAILFAGPEAGYGEYEVTYRPFLSPGKERINGKETLSGYIVGLQTSVKAGTLRITPFLSYEGLGSHATEDRTAGNSRTTDRAIAITQYGAEVLFRGGLTLGITFQHWSSGGDEERYRLYQVGYQF